MPKQSIHIQCNPFWRQRSRVFSHANGHKGTECHPAIDCPKHFAAVVAIQPFERGRIEDLREAGWTYLWIAAHVEHNVSVVCLFQKWAVEHSYTRRPGSGRPRSIEARQDRRILQAAVAASREEIRAHVAPVESPKTIGNFCLKRHSVHVCLWPGYRLNHDIAKHGCSGVVKDRL